ncbi:MAG: sporulation/spore germination protein [Brasilonema angustatum HA4187-MV1]|nr:sporulation/spore germination protein [Brasilonema angustatum HA4187-MV1]
MNQVIKLSRKHVVSFVVVGIIVSLSSCCFGSTSGYLESITPALGTTKSKTSTPTAQQIPTEETLIQNQTSSSSGAVIKQTVNVNLFTSDTQCQELIPQKVSVSAQAPVTGAVGKIIEQYNSSDFILSGYRVTVKGGVATVDLRIPPNSGRQFTSLSDCEQFALFGSLRKTLLSNSQWSIKEVRLMEKGKEIIL